MPRPHPIAPFPLSSADRRRLERHHRQQSPCLFRDNLPWAEPGFARRFTLLTDVRRPYWGAATPDVERLLVLLPRARRRPRHVIDLCCGAGRHALELARHGVRVTGLDVSEYAVRRARGKAAAARLPARFRVADVLDPPPTDPADLAAILCEQVVNFPPEAVRALLGLWFGRLRRGGTLVVEIPTELPPYTDELFFQAEPLFFERPCWVRYTQDPDPIARTLRETFTCLPEPGTSPVSFFNSRKYYTPREIADAAPARTVQVLDLPASGPRPDLQWVILR